MTIARIFVATAAVAVFGAASVNYSATGRAELRCATCEKMDALANGKYNEKTDVATAQLLDRFEFSSDREVQKSEAVSLSKLCLRLLSDEIADAGFDSSGLLDMCYGIFKRKPQLRDLALSQLSPRDAKNLRQAYKDAESGFKRGNK